ncbi:MAG: polysaccharide biosynthesis/export family protein [Candidatus Sulfomarinibacteraceae bacterium]
MPVALIALLLIGIAVAPSAAQETGPIETSAYRVGAGDVLAVEAYTHDEISGSFAVEAGGDISFPLLGRIRVEGRTTSEIADHLETLLEKDYYVDVQLQVEVEEYRSQPVTVLGEVSRPGTFYLEGRTSLHKILAEAGGIKTTAGAFIELRRLEGSEQVAEPVVRVFETQSVATGEQGRDVILKPGDVVSVSAKQRYFITGEISKPGQYDLSPGMTLMQAISQAGGQGKFASQTVEVHRGGDGDKEILTFDLAHIRKGKAADPVIEAGDVLIIRRRFF